MKRFGVLTLILLAALLLCPAVAAGESDDEPENMIVCGDYGYIPLPDGTAEIVRYEGDGEHVVVPAVLDGIPVTGIGSGAFEEERGLVSITIPEGVTAIGSYAFSRCLRLQAVSLPDGLTVIGDSAFQGTSGLEELSIPDSVAEIGDAAFFASGLKAVKLPAGLRRIGGQAFQQTHLATVEIPDGTEEIEHLAFCDCKELTDIFLPDSLASVTGNPFLYCSGLTGFHFSDAHPYLEMKDGVLFSRPDARLICWPEALGGGAYVIPDGTKIIGVSAFKGLKEVTIPDSVETIEDYAFGHCPLISVTIPDSVTSIGEGAFYCCTKLTRISLPAGIPAIPKMAFDGCTALVSLSVPEGVALIDGYAFRSCTALTAVDLPDSLTEIGPNAFNSCRKLASLKIPAQVTKIGSNAFYGCKALTAAVQEGTYAQVYCAENGVPYSTGE